MQNSTTNSTGPLFWITSGKVDAVLNFKFPHNPKNEHLFNLPEVLVDAIPTALVLLSLDCIPSQRELAKLPLVAPMGSHWYWLVFQGHESCHSSFHSKPILCQQYADQANRNVHEVSMQVQCLYVVPIYFLQHTSHPCAHPSQDNQRCGWFWWHLDCKSLTSGPAHCHTNIIFTDVER